MSASVEVQISDKPSRQAVAAPNRSTPLKVTGRLKVAIDAMVWEGSRRPQAAATAGMTDHSVRCALSKPHVKAYYLQQLEVLRTSERARNIHTLAEVRDQTGNQMARVAAAKALEGTSDQQVASGATQTPGVVIQIISTTDGARSSVTAGPIINASSDLGPVDV